MALGGCPLRGPRKLDDASVRGFLDELVGATVRRDDNAVCNLVAEDAEVTLAMIRFSGSDIRTYDKPQYCQMVRDSFAGIPAQASYNVNVRVDKINFMPGGRNAVLDVNVDESISMAGRPGMQMSTRQQMTLVLTDGRLLMSEAKAWIER